MALLIPAAASRRLLAATLLLATWAAGPGDASAQAEPGGVDQEQVEAAYLYKFGGYVTWPDKAFPAPDSPLVIGVAGADALAGDLESLVSGRNIGGRAVTVRRIHSESQLTGVHILFVSGRGGPAGLVESSRGQSILVVTEGAGGLAQGGAISFVMVDDRVRFDVSLDAVQQNGLKLSALLLSVAHSVNGAKP